MTGFCGLRLYINHIFTYRRGLLVRDAGHLSCRSEKHICDHGFKAEGTIVHVVTIENDWMQLRDGTFILYGNGEFAEKL